jgi:hypothetical protein
MITVDQYTNLLTSEHSNRPRFRAMVEAVSQCFVDHQNMLLSLTQAFDLDTSVGAQLDADGRWIGLSRSILAPLDNVFFSFDDDANGFDAGIWYLPHQPTYGLTAFDDETYRLLLKAKIAANKYDGTLPSMVTILREIFSPATVVVTDNMDMTIDVTITGQPPSTLFKYLVLGGYMPIKPAGIQLSYTFS